MLLALLASLALPPDPASGAGAIVVSAAASLRSPFEEIGALSAGSPGAPRPVFNFGASGELVTQIRGGAPVDVFAAAAVQDMDALQEAGLLLPGTRVDVASNAIVLVLPSASTTPVSSAADLANPRIVRIAIGNPKTVPAGRYAEAVFASAGIADLVRPKLVLAGNVSQVLDYVARGEVDAGVVYATEAAARPREVKVAFVAPASSHPPVLYSMAVLKGTPHIEAAEAFVAAVCSAAGRGILARRGFTPVPCSH